MDNRPRSFRRGAIASALGVIVVVARAAGAAPAPLTGTEIPAGAVLASGGGLIGMVTPDGRRLTIWNEDGTLHADAAVVPPRAGDAPMGLALRGRLALIAYIDTEQRSEIAVVFDLERRSKVRQFSVDPAPSRIAAASTGWLAEFLAPGTVPQLRLLDDRGKVIRTIPAPEDVVQRSTQAFGDPSYAFLRVTDVGGTLWAVPSLAYELWSVTPGAAWHRTTVPACLAVRARRLEGDVASARIRRFASEAPAAEGESLIEHLRQSEGKGLRIVTTVSAARTVQSRGDEIAVLTEPEPERASGGCRLDVWHAGDPAPSAVVPISGPCPSFVAVTAAGAWIVQHGRMLPLPFSLERKSDPCSS